MNTQIKTVEPQSGKSPQAVIWIAGIALTLFCAVGIAAVMGWIPNSMGGPDDKAPMALPSANTPAAAKPRTARAPSPRAAEAVHTAPLQVAAVAKCTDCGVIESVREVEKAGQGTGLGVVGGAVVGGVLGNQVGGGTGKDVMTVVGAVAGGVAGNQIEKKVRSTKVYEITVRMDDGDSRVVTESTAPSWRQGDKVRLIDGKIQPNNA